MNSNFGINLSWPVDKSIQVSQYFGEHPENYLSSGNAGHEGWDWIGAFDSDIYAVYKSTVVHAGEYTDGRKAYGLCIYTEFEFNGRKFGIYYAHLSMILVRVGDVIEQGQVIAKMGYSGNCYPPNIQGTHLHITVKAYGEVTSGYIAGIVDPAPYFSQALLSGPVSEGEIPISGPENIALIDTETGVNELIPGRYRLNGFMNLREAPTLSDNILNAQGSELDFIEIKYDHESGITFGKVEIKGWIAIKSNKGSIFAEKI